MDLSIRALATPLPALPRPPAHRRGTGNGIAVSTGPETNPCSAGHARTPPIWHKLRMPQAVATSAKRSHFLRRNVICISHGGRLHGLPAWRKSAGSDPRRARALRPADARDNARVQLLGERVRFSTRSESSHSPHSHLHSRG